MKAVIQRVKRAALSVDGKLISKINGGLCIYLGVRVGDTVREADYLIRKIALMRIFEDDNGKMNLSAVDTKAEILLISQFTLLADISHGNRPGFTDAELPEKANKLYEYFGEGMRECGLTVKTGVFGADMQIDQLNDGPVTIIIESR